MHWSGSGLYAPIFSSHYTQYIVLGLNVTLLMTYYLDGVKMLIWVPKWHEHDPEPAVV